MSTAGIISEEIEKQALLAEGALQDIAGVNAGSTARQALPRAIVALLAPYSAALQIAELVQSGPFNAELVQAVHRAILPLERMAGKVLSAARQRGYFDAPDAAEPLRWLETCDEQVKDCMVALESMLDPQLASIMAAAKDEHQRGETVPLDSIL